MTLEGGVALIAGERYQCRAARDLNGEGKTLLTARLWLGKGLP